MRLDIFFISRYQKFVSIQQFTGKSYTITPCNDSFICLFKSYDKLEETFGEQWSWDSESKIKAAGLLAQARDFGHIMAFTVALNGLEPIKPLVWKLQRRNQDIFKRYHMIENVIDCLKEMRAEVNDKFSD